MVAPILHFCSTQTHASSLLGFLPKFLFLEVQDGHHCKANLTWEPMVDISRLHVYSYLFIPIVKQCPVMSANLHFLSTKKENLMTIHVLFRFSLFPTILERVFFHFKIGSYFSFSVIHEVKW
jgi:hypothetical protein